MKQFLYILVFLATVFASAQTQVVPNKLKVLNTPEVTTTDSIIVRDAAGLFQHIKFTDFKTQLNIPVGLVNNLIDLGDVTGSTATNRFALIANGTSFVSRLLTEADISDLSHSTEFSEAISFTGTQASDNLVVVIGSETGTDKAFIKIDETAAINGVISFGAGTQSDLLTITGNPQMITAAAANGFFISEGKLALRTGGTFYSNFFSDLLTADRDFQLPDKPGTFALLTDIIGGDALTTNPLSQFAATTSAQLAGVISNETGAGQLVFGLNPVFSNNITVEGNVVVDTGGAILTDGIIESTLNNGVDIESVPLKDGLVDSRDVSVDGIKLDLILGTNTGDQTSIVGITGTKAEFNTALTDDDFAYQSDLGSTAITYKTITDGYNVIPSDGENVILYYAGGTDITINVDTDANASFVDNILVTTYADGAGKIKINYQNGVTGDLVQSNKDLAHYRTFSIGRNGVDNWIPFGDFETYVVQTTPTLVTGLISAITETNYIDVVVPTGVVLNDILLLNVHDGPQSTFTTPTGWNLLFHSNQGAAGGSTAAFYWKRADGTETGNLRVFSDVTNVATEAKFGVMSKISGCITTGTPFEVVSTVAMASSSTYTIPAMTALGNNRLAVYMLSIDDNPTLSGGTNWIQKYEFRSTTGLDANLAMYTQDVNSGLVASEVLTNSLGSDYAASVAILFIPQ